MSNPDIVSEFGTLEWKIQQFAGHFGVFKELPNLTIFNNASGEENKTRYLRAKIADWVDEDLFMVRPSRLGRHRAGLPVDREVLPVELAAAEDRRTKIRSMAYGVYWLLNPYVELKDKNGTSTLTALQELYGFAYDLAFRVQESTTVYEWQQQAENGRSTGGSIKDRILFRPVYKLTDQGIVCVRQGETLIPGRGR